MPGQKLEYFENNTRFEGYLSYDQQDAKKRPAVLVIHDWTGINDHAKERADWLADLGYVGFAVDMYGEGKNGQNNEEKTKLITPFLEERNLIVKRLQAALEALKQNPNVDVNNIACMGFCFGGLCALDSARANLGLKAVISFHGILNPPNYPTHSPMSTKILAMHGYDDPMVPVEQVNAFQKEMANAKADWVFISYGNTTHAFTNKLANDPSFGTVYNKQADERSWKATKHFLAEVFEK